MNTVMLAEVGAMVGDPARANMLIALMDGRALAAGELAYAAGVTAQTASGHLARMTAAGLLACASQGRHRYYRLASAEVAGMIEAMMQVAAVGPVRRRPARIDPGLTAARTCYDHLAGRLGVALCERLVARGDVVLDAEAGALTPAGSRALAEFGIDIAALSHGRRCFCRPCLDWSERRPHLGGALGAALARRLFALRWIERVRDGRAVTVTPTGRSGLAQAFALEAA